MATKTETILNDGYGKRINWSGLANGETGDAISVAEFADRSVQVSGTFGSGGTVVLEGSNDGTNWATLNDLQGDALSLSAAKIEGVSELTYQVRPRVTAGDGTTDITVTLFARRTV